MNSCCIQLRVLQTPDREDFGVADEEALRGDWIVRITQEFDSDVDLIVNGHNLLNGYPGALVYPVHALLRSFNNGLHSLLLRGQSVIPVYLQQYNFLQDSPQHELGIQLADDDCWTAAVSFQWFPFTSRPRDLPIVEGERVPVSELVTEIVNCVALFKRTVQKTLANFGPQGAVQPDRIFEDFADLRESRRVYRSRMIKS